MAARRAPQKPSGDGSSADEAGKPPRAAGAASSGRASRRHETRAARQGGSTAEICVASSPSSNDASPAVVDTWPAKVLIAIREVDVVEAFLGRLIDEILSDDT